ncbi:MAG: putative toxin-antitoxin system toxin component, PIN family [Vicinamibacterales bacterium]
MRVFFDTNVVLTAFATRGLCADLFAHVLLEHELVVGETVIRELRSKLRTKLKLAKNAIDEIEALLRDQTVVKTPAEHLKLGISDPDDEWIVAEAMAGEADALVTGDALHKLGKRAPMPIVTPRGLWDLLRGADRVR